jgi:hypothetical protein
MHAHYQVIVRGLIRVERLLSPGHPRDTPAARVDYFGIIAEPVAEELREHALPARNIGDVPNPMAIGPGDKTSDFRESGRVPVEIVPGTHYRNSSMSQNVDVKESWNQRWVSSANETGLGSLICLG